MEAISDKKIKDEVLKGIQSDARVNPNEIGVSVKNGVVTLTGWMESYTRRWVVEEVAHRVRGVKATANDIAIHQNETPAVRRILPSENRTDSDIASLVVGVLEGDASVAIEAPDIRVAQGWVTLKGKVGRPSGRLDAERIVRGLAGMRGVTNRIAMKTGVKPDRVKKKIERMLVRGVRADAERIQVETMESKVILKGEVRSWAEKDDAERAALAAPGVEAVENRITISP